MARKKAAEPSGSGQVHLYVGISLDGYLAAPDGGVDWLDPYGDARARYSTFIKTIGSAVMGRATYDFAAAHGHLDFGMPAYVLTHRALPSSRSVTGYAGDLHVLVSSIRAKHPGDIWLMGGGIAARAFLDEDLVDIWSIAFVPTLLGAGLPMFPPGRFLERRLRLTRTQQYPSGAIELRYGRA